MRCNGVGAPYLYDFSNVNMSMIEDISDEDVDKKQTLVALSEEDQSVTVTDNNDEDTSNVSLTENEDVVSPSNCNKDDEDDSSKTGIKVIAMCKLIITMSYE